MFAYKCFTYFSVYLSAFAHIYRDINGQWYNSYVHTAYTCTKNILDFLKVSKYNIYTENKYVYSLTKFVLERLRYKQVVTNYYNEIECSILYIKKKNAHLLLEYDYID